MSVISLTRKKRGNEIRKGRATKTPQNKHTLCDWWKYLSGDAAVLVEIVQIKGPVEFISDGASQDDGQTYDKVLQQGEAHLLRNVFTEGLTNTTQSPLALNVSFGR